MPQRVTATAVAPDLLFLPWDTPLAEWPEELITILPKGISRHEVRFVTVNNIVFAVKEIQEAFAQREYELLTKLRKLGAPCVKPVGVVAKRADKRGEDLPAALITEHLSYSLPYRSLVRQTLTAATAERLLDALVLLIVKLHLLGFAWNDCSLSNTLFRRDAGAFAAYLVDAETGDLQPKLSRGQRAYDIDTASLNVTGEFMDLQAGGLLPEEFDPVELGEQLTIRYEHLWNTLNDPIAVSLENRQDLHTLIRTLNGLGFDIAELSAETTDEGARIVVTPKVVDAGHHRRRLHGLTGLDTDENLARRLLNDIDTFRMEQGLPDGEEQVAAHRWVREVYEPVLARVPRALRKKLVDPQIMHEVLEHRWYLAERRAKPVSLLDAADNYVATELIGRPDDSQPPLDTTGVTPALPQVLAQGQR
ncbi:MAG: DUF4032 domain-containing protein [Candidatus Nanopelagicales bacterium]